MVKAAGSGQRRGRVVMPGRFLLATDHRRLGLQYGLTSAFFLLVGFWLVSMLRLQLAYPHAHFGMMERIFPEGFPAGMMTPDFYNQLGAMHGTIMVFLGVVPMAVNAFGNYLVPLFIGANDTAFPRLNRGGYWCFLLGGGLMLASFLAAGGGPQSGWTSYPPLAVVLPGGQTLWLWGMILLGISAGMGAINMFVTILHHRAAGMGLFQLPLFVWTQLAAAVLLLLAFPPLEAASFLQLADRIWGTSFFLPSGLVVGGEKLLVAGGGNPLLWQHLFWFLAHPEVYVLILPAVGIVGEILSLYSERPIYGYRSIVYAILFLTLMSFLVWAHHLFLAGMGTRLSHFFQLTTLIISVPSVVILTSLLLTLWGASLRFPVAMCFALAFLPMFGLGGLSGLPLALAASDLHLHDTYYVIGHFHYLVAPGTLFALFAGVYHWFPLFSGRRLSETWGKVHFWGSFLCMNAIFLPMFSIGMAGVSRRMYDVSLYRHGASVFWLNQVMSIAAWGLAAFQLVFLINIARTLWQKTPAPAAPAPPRPVVPRETGESRHPLTGLTDSGLGMRLFVSSQIMFWGALVAAYFTLRDEVAWAPLRQALHRTWGIAYPIGGALFAGLVIAGRRRLAGFVALFTILAKVGESLELARHGFWPAASNFWGLYFLFFSLHAAGWVAGAGWLFRRSGRGGARGLYAIGVALSASLLYLCLYFG